MSAQTVTVSRGIAYLDEHLPGWQDEIDWDELKMDTCEGCILGQLFGNYNRGLRILGLDSDEKARRFGFLTNGQFEKLNAIWKRLVAT